MDAKKSRFLEELAALDREEQELILKAREADIHRPIEEIWAEVRGKTHPVFMEIVGRFNGVCEPAVH